MRLTLTEEQHQSLMQHLFPDDGFEAVAICLCGRSVDRLLVSVIYLIPYEKCSVRRGDRVTWPTHLLLPMLAEARRKNMAVVKFHGHREFDQFSDIDDLSDRQLFPCLYAWTETEAPHGSVILMGDGRAFGRVVTETGDFQRIASISVVGHDIKYFYGVPIAERVVPEFGRRVAQVFGAATFEALRRLRIGVVGCSGTGSPLIEQLARSCAGSLVLVDPDVIEEKNLNRIYNATMEHALRGTSKVDVAVAAIAAMGLSTEVESYSKDLFDSEVVRALSSCDIVFGCMDTIDGRFFLNKLATFYLIPYFDLGVKIEVDKEGGVQQVCGTVHYVRPGGSSLLSRHVFSLEQVRAAGLKRKDPEQYAKLLDEGYLRGSDEDRPAVIQLNSLIASLAVSELMARLNPYRIDPNLEYAVTRISLVHAFLDHEREGGVCNTLRRHVGRGDVEPLLDWPELSSASAS